MARVERDREDLLAEATALVERVELELPGRPDHVLIGFRASGCGSLYLGPDEAYHFNTDGALRRAYRDGVLYKAERGRLVGLWRQRTSQEVQLIRRELDPAATAEFSARLSTRLEELQQALVEKPFRVMGQVPSDADVVGRATTWLGSLPPGAIARTPHAR